MTNTSKNETMLWNGTILTQNNDILKEQNDILKYYIKISEHSIILMR